MNQIVNLLTDMNAFISFFFPARCRCIVKFNFSICDPCQRNATVKCIHLNVIQTKAILSMISYEIVAFVH